MVDIVETIQKIAWDHSGASVISSSVLLYTSIITITFAAGVRVDTCYSSWIITRSLRVLRMRQTEDVGGSQFQARDRYNSNY